MCLCGYKVNFYDNLIITMLHFSMDNNFHIYFWQVLFKIKYITPAEANLLTVNFEVV